jgi:hypothetical protein
MDGIFFLAAKQALHIEISLTDGDMHGHAGTYRDIERNVGVYRGIQVNTGKYRGMH